MVTNKTLLLIFVTLASVTAQTFQYSRGWTNGKRDGHRREETRDIPARDIARGISASLDKIITPCQMNKLKYMCLKGRLCTMSCFTCHVTTLKRRAKALNNATRRKEIKSHYLKFSNSY